MSTFICFLWLLSFKLKMVFGLFSEYAKKKIEVT